MRFNLNDYVKVQLTKAGHDYLKEDFDALNLSLGGKLKEYRAPNEDADGWSRWQLLDLMSRFGHRIAFGSVCPIGIEIEIPTKE